MRRLPAEIEEIDGLRGLAILAVIVHRLWPRAAAGQLSAVAGSGWIGVDLFFVVSGFLIARILLDTRDDPDYFRNFYARRMLRIFPLYYLFVGTLLLAFPLVGGGGYLAHAGSPAWYLTFLGNVPEGALGYDPPYWLAPVWSLAIEEQFYLTFPHLVRRLSTRRLAHVLVALLVAALVIRGITVWAWPDAERVQYLMTPCRVDAIAAGCLLALIVRWPRVAELRRPAVVAAVAASAIALATGLDRTTTFGRVGGYSVVALGFAAIVLVVLLSPGERATAILRLRPLRYVGRLCFGLYLLHRPADTLVDAIATRAGVDANRISWIPIKIAAALSLASLSWIALERPMLRLKRHFVSACHPSRRRFAVAMASAVAVVGCNFHMSIAGGDGPTRRARGVYVDDDQDVHRAQVAAGHEDHRAATARSTPQTAATARRASARSTASRARVHRTLTSEVKIVSRLAEPV